MTSLYRVYVLKNPFDRLYIGISDNVDARLAQHNCGKSKWTKGKGPWRVIWTSQGLSTREVDRDLRARC